jgi:hypothetical protein
MDFENVTLPDTMLPDLAARSALAEGPSIGVAHALSNTADNAPASIPRRGIMNFSGKSLRDRNKHC